MSKTKPSRDFLCCCRLNDDGKNPAWGWKHNGSSIWRRWPFLVAVLVMLQYWYNTSYYRKYNAGGPTVGWRKFKRHSRSDTTTLERFLARKSSMERMGLEEEPVYPSNISICSLNLSTLGPITANKTKLSLEWVDQQYPEVKAGGFYAPAHCRPRHKVAILVPYRARETNLAIFLYHIHPFLKKQLIQYRVFVIEQYRFVRNFNKGSLYNVAFLEIQRFGDWHCMIFHDVDLLPLDQRILYSCPKIPTHMSAAVEQHGFHLPYSQLFGGVTAMTVAQYSSVNGYSNSYWDWGAEDDDMFTRLQARRLPMARYNATIARYASLPHTPNEINYEKGYALSLAKRRFRSEGLNTIEYKLHNITKRRLFTHILVDVNPYNIQTQNIRPFISGTASTNYQWEKLH